jgi:hypothetical protein
MLEETGSNYVACAFTWGSLPHAQAMRSLRLFSEEVMPALRQSSVAATG